MLGYGTESEYHVTGGHVLGLSCSSSLLSVHYHPGSPLPPSYMCLALGGNVDVFHMYMYVQLHTRRPLESP